MNHTWKMHTKILILCLGLTFFALSFQTFLFQKTSSKTIYQQAQDESFQSMQHMQEDVYSLVKHVEKALIESYNEREFIRDLKAGTKIEVMRETYYRQAYNIATNHFDPLDRVVALYLYTNQDEIISSYRRAVTPKHKYPLDIYQDEQEYHADIVRRYAASDDTTMLISSYYNSAREKRMLRFVLKLYNHGNSSNRIGYIVCDMDSRNLLDIMQKYNTDENNYLWFQPLGDEPALSLGSLEENEKEEVENFQKGILQGKKEEKEILAFGSRVCFHAEQSKYNFGVYSLMPQELLYRNHRALLGSMLMIVCATFAVTVVVSYFVTRSLTRPLERMTDTAQKITSGEIGLRMDELKDDEIGQLGQRFNEMLDRIEELIGREYETKLLLNRAQYHALQAQINPHFLYNTLDTMGSIAEMQNCRKVSALCQSLSNIFRYSLDMKHSFSTIASEIVHLKNYIYVMDVRMQDHISYHFDLDEKALRAAIPRLSIQPIVENALNHGLRNSKGCKEVWITAKEHGDGLMLMVRDNGVGMPQETIEKLLDVESGEERESATSIGIYNIHMRLRMLYGEEYGLSITSEPGEGTSVFLHIPNKSIEEAEHENF